MDTGRTLLNWIHSFTNKFGCEPKIIHITREERESTRASPMMNYGIPSSHGDMQEIFGVDVNVSPFAECARTRILQLEVSEFFKAAEVSELHFNFEETTNHALQSLIMEMRAYIASDTTLLKVTIEYDPWRWLKKWCQSKEWLRWMTFVPAPPGQTTGRWRNCFNIRTKDITVDCKALYPHMKVQLPHVRHHVKMEWAR
jgi:hypothetical protein